VQRVTVQAVAAGQMHYAVPLIIDAVCGLQRAREDVVHAFQHFCIFRPDHIMNGDAFSAVYVLFCEYYGPVPAPSIHRTAALLLFPQFFF